MRQNALCCGTCRDGTDPYRIAEKWQIRLLEITRAGVSLFLCFSILHESFRIARPSKENSRVPNSASCTCKLCNAHLVQRTVAYRRPPRAHAKICIVEKVAYQTAPRPHVKFVSSKHSLNC